MHVSSASRMTSYSTSCQPTRHCSTMTCLIGLARRPARTRSQYASSVSTMPDASIVMPAADVPAFAPESKKILEDMLRAAIGLQHNYIGTEHMLLAVLGTENSGLAVLRDLGVAPESLDERVHALIADATDASG